MWLALIMAFNVWFVIWPNQKSALGLVEADDATKAKSARTAMLTSRINTLLSIPMLLAMTNAQRSAPRYERHRRCWRSASRHLRRFSAWPKNKGKAGGGWLKRLPAQRVFEQLSLIGGDCRRTERRRP